MTIEQEKALKVCEKLVSCMTDHTLSAEDIMILIQGILSNDCGGCNWKYVQVPQYQPGLEPDRQPGYRPGEVWCGATEVMKNMNFKNETESLAELKKKLEEHGYADNPIKFDPKLIEKVNGTWTYTNSTKPKFCAGDNIPDIQQVIH